MLLLTNSFNKQMTKTLAAEPQNRDGVTIPSTREFPVSRIQLATVNFVGVKNSNHYIGNSVFDIGSIINDNRLFNVINDIWSSRSKMNTPKSMLITKRVVRSNLHEKIILA